jgi:hypothetical protein
LNVLILNVLILDALILDALVLSDGVSGNPQGCEERLCNSHFVEDEK